MNDDERFPESIERSFSDSLDHGATPNSGGAAPTHLCGSEIGAPRDPHLNGNRAHCRQPRSRLARRSNILRACAHCGVEFRVEPRHPDVRYCGTACYGLSQRGRHRSPLPPQREAVRRAKISASLRVSANKKGLVIGQRAPSQIPTGLGNPNSKRWVLCDPEGALHECYGLRSWAKANIELFGAFNPENRMPAHLIILQRLSVVASGGAEHFRNWTVVERAGLPLEEHLRKVAEQRSASRQRKNLNAQARRTAKKMLCG